MRTRYAFCALLAVLVILAVGQAPGAAANSPPPGLKMEAEAAFDGFFKYGEWLPVWVLVENNGSDLNAEVRVRVTGTWGVTTFAAPAPLPTGSRKRIPVYVLPNNYSHQLEAQLVRGDEVLDGQKVAINPQPNISYLVGLVAPERGALAMILGASLPGQHRPKQLIDLTVADLPERVEGLRSFDCLILNDVDSSTLTPEQGAALEAWVRQGGRLVIGGGAGGRRTVAGLPESLLPLAPDSEVEIEALPALADFTGAEAIRVPGPFLLATGETHEGRTLVAQADWPLLRERTVGAGVVDFVALDLVTSPFDAWAGTTAFWEKLLAPGAAYPQWLPPDLSQRQMISGQMSYALSNLPALDLPSIRGLGLLLILYVVLVGPVNYVLLRWRKRLHRAWISIPLITLAFSAGAFGLGYALRGNDLIVNKVAVIELEPDGTASVKSYLGLFSPERQSYEIEVIGGGLLSPLNPDYDPWGSGGLNTANEMVFVQGDPGRVRGLAVNQWSMQTFMTEGMALDFGRITGDLRVEGEQLMGSLRNETAHALTGAVLVMGNSFIRLGDLAAGQEAPVTMALSDIGSQHFGAPISWRLFEEEYTTVGSGVGPVGPPREAELKRSVLDSVFQQGGKLSMMSSVRFAWQGGSPQGLIFLAWLNQAPPDVQLARRAPAQQTTALVYTSLSFRLAEGQRASLPPGLIPGGVIQTPIEGGPCGPDGASVYLGRGEAVFEFQIPTAARHVRVDTLKLVIGSDGGWWQVPDTALYDWSAGDWLTLVEPILGVNVIPDPAGLINDDGQVQVRLSSEEGGGGCLYLDLGLEGTQ